MKQDWYPITAPLMEQEFFENLDFFVQQEYASQTIYPPREQLYTAFELTGFEETKVLILGQDPYHGPEQAHGLSFSVSSETAKFPPSLRNIFKELKSDLGVHRENRNLSDWAQQGVLLLNTVLTVRAGQAASHRGKGWESFTDGIITALNKRSEPVVFILWGGDAKKKLPLIDQAHHRVITSAHPSPLSAYHGFFGSKPFSRINNYLIEIGRNPICWG